MKRGDFVTVAMQGNLGKPRPALILQSDRFDEHATITILPVTSTIVDAPLFRITIEPNETNGLNKPSQVMVDKTMTVVKEKVGKPFGKIEKNTMLEIERCLAVFLGFA
ncbi:MAG: type II toxin-antitoxin system PemK/MazF family toxin [Deltaproteobacteria bacterium]|jgi:mRNA interferase MazF|nr:type II toxin-antitoxin system PemK/MazF family toxin [Deltaproteobacteria bacterium]